MSSNLGNQKTSEKGQNMPSKQQSDEKVPFADRNKTTQDIDYAAVDGKVEAEAGENRDVKTQGDGVQAVNTKKQNNSGQDAGPKKPEQKSSEDDMQQKDRERKVA